MYNGWNECTLEEMRKNPGKVYHYTTEEAWEKIQSHGGMKGSSGTGLTNRGSHGIFTSTNPEVYAEGTYGNICLELNLEAFKNDSRLPELNLSYEPEVDEYLLREYVWSELKIESRDEIDSSGGMSPYTIIVGHNIPLKYIRTVD